MSALKLRNDKFECGPTTAELLAGYDTSRALYDKLQITQRASGRVPYADWAILYAVSVLEHRTMACLPVQAACYRFLHDLWKQGKDLNQFPWELNKDIAYEYCFFIEQLPFVQGRQAKENRLFTLSGFQIFITVNIFGWVSRNRLGNYIRRFSRGYIETPRKNGKTTHSVAMGLASYCLDEEEGPELYFIANKLDQAGIAFRIATSMVKRSTLLQERYGLRAQAKLIRNDLRNGIAKPLPIDPGDGTNPTFVLYDEYHEAKNSVSYDSMWNGMGAREQGLLVVSTTAGEDITSPCYLQRCYAVDTVVGRIQDDAYFSMIFGMDEGDVWSDRKVWYRTNPNLGITIEEERFIEAAREASNSPLKLRTFLVKRLGAWIRLGATLFDHDQWQSLTVDRDINALKGCRAWCGSDLAYIEDFAVVGGLVEIPKQFTNGIQKYRAVFTCWLPEQRLMTHPNKQITEWGKQGYIKTTPGNILDFDELVEFYRDFVGKFSVQIIQNDPNHASQLLVKLAGLGVPVVPLNQTANNLSEPTKWLMGMVKEGCIEHDGNPVIAWMMANVVAREDAGERIYPMKASSDRKIDAAIAIIIASAALIRQVAPEGPFKSYWSQAKHKYETTEPAKVSEQDRIIKMLEELD